MGNLAFTLAKRTKVMRVTYTILRNSPEVSDEDCTQMNYTTTPDFKKRNSIYMPYPRHGSTQSLRPVHVGRSAARRVVVRSSQFAIQKPHVSAQPQRNNLSLTQTAKVQTVEQPHAHPILEEWWRCVAYIID